MSSYTRAQALGAVGALSFAAPLLTRCAFAADRIDQGDLKSLGSELALERAAIKAYSDAAALNITSPAVLAVLNSFLTDHNAHRDAIIAAFTGSGQTAPDAAAPLDTPSLRTEADVLAFAYTIERSLADTHLSVVPLYKDRDYAKTAASILGVETTHVALLAQALGTRVYASGFVA